jgi:hypothetical protein
VRTPSDQRRPSLLFAAVNYLPAAQPGAALATYCPVHGARRPDLRPGTHLRPGIRL